MSKRNGSASPARPVLITGGVGFVGANLAHRLLSAGRPVRVLDNLSRVGVERNLQLLRDTHGAALQVEIADVRDAAAVARATADASGVFHFAAQVAVTTSLVEPIEDFEVNARGTLNVLEAVRALDDPPPVIFTSTNKVYGNLEDMALALRSKHYAPLDDAVRAHGVSEARPLRFHSPYGCSKGAADQYVLDYAHSFGVRALVFRMSCIYGPHQFGTEDQGWVAHFLIRALEGQPISLYGDGMQVRDVLFVDDLVDAFLLAEQQVDALAGRAFNIGGGPANATSLLDVVALIGELHGARPALRFHAWRTGDQRYYVSDTRAFAAATGWTPRHGIQEGVERLYEWLVNARAAARPAALAAAAREITR